MIKSIGIDLVEITRIREAYARFGDRYLQKIYSPDEIIAAKREGACVIDELAGRFAAKEAVMKALGYFFDSGVYLRDIEILGASLAAATVRLPERVSGTLGSAKVLISISCQSAVVAATAIISDEE